MPDYTVHKASELAPEERSIVERWLGRNLSQDETISVNAYRPHSAPATGQRGALRHEILDQARTIGLRSPDTSEADADLLVNEAFAWVRGTRG
jgi:hypothetical protein